MNNLIERINTHGHCGGNCIACDLLKEAAAALKQAQADCAMKDKRIDWTVEDNVKKALRIEQLEKEKDHGNN